MAVVELLMSININIAIFTSQSEDGLSPAILTLIQSLASMNGQLSPVPQIQRSRLRQRGETGTRYYSVPPTPIRRTTAAQDLAATSNPEPTGKQPDTTPKKTASKTISKPLVVEDDVIVISSDSDDDPPAPKRKPTSAKPKRQPRSDVSAVSKRHNAIALEKERLPAQQTKKKKRPREVDANEEQDHEYQRLRKKAVEMQAKNQQVKRKLEAPEKEVHNLKTELMGKNVNIDDLHQHFECVICMETLWQPWALSDCGHTFCQMCLISLFNSNKFECPTCRTSVKHPPVEVFAFRSMIRAVAGAAPPEVDMPAEGGRVWDRFWPPAAPAQEHRVHPPISLPPHPYPHAHAHAYAHARPRRR